MPPAKRTKKPRHLGLIIAGELYEKAQRLALAEDRSVSGVVRRLIAEAPEPKSALRAEEA